MTYPWALRMDTDLDAPELKTRLTPWQPWGHRIEFSNGVTTADMERRTPFSDAPLVKLDKVRGVIPFDRLRRGLDVGCNSGHNSIDLTRRHNIQMTGIDVTPRHIEVSQALAEMGGLQIEFERGDAEQWTRPDEFDLVVHFGTLYHLPNPIQALQATADNLKEGGWLALETQVYDDPTDPHLCYWMRGHNNDLSNFWAVSSMVLRECLEGFGFVKIQECFRVSPPQMDDRMSRVVWAAQKTGARPEF